jgi:hypothetical protein
MTENTTHLRPDGTTFPPLTPDPPPPPGYEEPDLADVSVVAEDEQGTAGAEPPD